MEIYLAIMTTVLVVSQIVRCVQNAIQLHRQEILFKEQLGQLKDITQEDLDYQKRAYRAIVRYLEGGEEDMWKGRYEDLYGK